MLRKSHLVGWLVVLALLLVGLMVVRAQSERPAVSPDSVPRTPIRTTQLTASSQRCPYCDSNSRTFHYFNCPVAELNKNVQDTKRSVRSWAERVKERAERLGRPRGHGKCLFCEASIGHSFNCPLKKIIDDADRLANAARW